APSSISLPAAFVLYDHLATSLPHSLINLRLRQRAHYSLPCGPAGSPYTPPPPPVRGLWTQLP
ncbi:hypothetical protein U9M48_041909, partial [Paspalum notatum var. saurae]